VRTKEEKSINEKENEKYGEEMKAGQIPVDNLS